MTELENAHGSLLSLIATYADDFNIDAVNLDAIADEVDLPSGDFIGLQSFSITSANDYSPLPLVSAMIVVATRSDTNNMQLIKRLGIVFKELQPANMFNMFNLETGEVIGDFKLIGTTRVLPVTRDKTLALQGITFQAALQYVE